MQVFQINQDTIYRSKKDMKKTPTFYKPEALHAKRRGFTKIGANLTLKCDRKTEEKLDERCC